MFKLGVLSLLLVGVLAVTGSEMDKYLGAVTPVAVFSEPKVKRCEAYSFYKADENANCVCGDKTNLPTYGFQLGQPDQKFDFVPIVVDSSSEVAAAVAIKDCICGGKKVDRLVFRPISDNYFVHYEGLSNEPNLAILYVKNAPKISELESVIKSIDDLAQRSYTLVCESSFFAN